MALLVQTSIEKIRW